MLSRSALPIAALLALAAPAAAQESPAEPAANPGEDPVVRAVARIGPAVANIAAEQENGTGPHVQSLGSGLCVHSLGFVVTNAHVVEGAKKVLVTLPGRRRAEARVLSVLPEQDLALLRIRADAPLPVGRIAADDALQVGQTCVALGNPFGLESTVTRGVVSARSRKLRVGARVLPGTFLQTDAAINPGNSGGPLVDLRGEVIGLTTAIQQNGHGIGFAIPAARLREGLLELSDPLLQRGLWLGLSLEDGPRGATVAAVASGGPAARAGLRPGDVIHAAGPCPVDSVFSFQATVLGVHGTNVRLMVQGRDGERRGALLEGEAPPWRARLRERLGLLADDLTPSRAWRLELEPGGLLLAEVDAAGPAADLGLAAGDRVFQVVLPGEDRAREVPDQRALDRLLAPLPAGAVIELTIRRKGQDYRGALVLR
ncbi:MAG: S1C family serine protease [Planctomycetota bacterium]